MYQGLSLQQFITHYKGDPSAVAEEPMEKAKTIGSGIDKGLSGCQNIFNWYEFKLLNK